MTSPSTYSTPAAKAAKGISPDLPLLMYGSGDVSPEHVNPDTVSLLAEYTTTYVAALVDAAVDAHDVLTDGLGAAPIRPSRKRKNSSVHASKAKVRRWKARERKRRLRERGLPSDDREHVDHTKENDDDEDEDEEEDDEYDEDEDYVGAVGINLNSRSRSNTKSLSAATAIDPKCFIFPICHDAALYGKVMDIQAARRELAPLMMDPIMTDMMKEEVGENADFPLDWPEDEVLPVHKL